jgi:hypothetical protein
MLVVEEAAFMDESRWYSEMRPTLAAKEGEAVFISTFNGENWFYDLYELGQDPAEEDWASWRKPTAENPHIPPEELERARRTTPQAEFEQEYLANPLVYVGAVFPGEKLQAAVERGASSLAEAPQGEYYAGLDWGYAHETAFEVCVEDAEGRIHWVDERRWVATQLAVRSEEIVELCRHYGIVWIYADAAGSDENAHVWADLRAAKLATRLKRVPFNKYNDSGIKVRRWYLENDLETLSPKCPGLIHDSKRYRYKEDSEDIEKKDDHTVDAATAFYASRRGALVSEKGPKTRRRLGHVA